jgi:hypothetical protein
MTYSNGQVVEDADGIKFTVQYWSIESILQNVVLSSDFEEFDGTPSMWAYIIASKGGDSQTPTLLQRISEEGFTVPICLFRDRFGNWGIGNGHHRLVCAILLGLDEIPAFVSDDPEEHYPTISDGPELPAGNATLAKKIYNSWCKIYKTLAKQELVALEEEAKIW